MLKRLILLALALGGVACTPPQRGTIDASGYRHKDYKLKVVANADGELMGEDWVLDNYHRSEYNRLEPKSSEGYVATYQLDMDGDGKMESSAEEYIYELRFTHKKHDGVIFLRMVPLSRNQGEKKLTVMLNRYVEAVAGAGYEVVQLTEHTKIVVEKRYAVAVAKQSEAGVAGLPALGARLEVANLDQIKIDPNARKEQVALVIAHTDFLYKHSVPARQNLEAEYPVLFLASYANQPEDFEAGLKDFHEFLGRIQIKGEQGFGLVTVEEEPAKDPSAVTEPASDSGEPDNKDVEESEGRQDEGRVEGEGSVQEGGEKSEPAKNAAEESEAAAEVSQKRSGKGRPPGPHNSESQ